MRALEDGDRYRVTFVRVVRSEWTKLRSLRSTWAVLGFTALLTVGFAGAFGYGYAGEVRDGKTQPGAAGAVDAAYLALDLSALILGVLGTVQLSGEFGSGQIRASLAAVPRRLLLVWAKALVLLAVVTVVMGPVCLLAFVVSQEFAGDAAASLGDPGVPRAVLGATGYVVATALLGLGVGALLRNTAAAITGFVAAFLIVPAMLPAALPDSLQRDVLPYLPIATAQAMYAGDPDGGPVRLLAPGNGAALLAGWLVAVLAAGTLVLHRRDA